MLEQSAAECDRALSLDPGNYMFRSCAWTFMELGQTERATDFYNSTPGRNGPPHVTPALLVREGKIAQAKEAAKHMPTAPRYHHDLVEACLGLRPASEQDRIAHELEANQANELDPEQLYLQGAWLGYCGKNQDALQLLQSAVERSYCAYSNLLNDPMLAKLRADQAFNKVLTEASACQEAVKSQQTQTTP